MIQVGMLLVLAVGFWVVVGVAVGKIEWWEEAEKIAAERVLGVQNSQALRQVQELEQKILFWEKVEKLQPNYPKTESRLEMLRNLLEEVEKR